MGDKKPGHNMEETIEELVEEYREQLTALFSKDSFDLTFDDREKLIDGKLDKGRCKILEKHIEEDPDGIAKNNYDPDETSLCHCGTCATLCRDKKGNSRIFDREIKTRRGIVTIREYGYYCSKCRKVFFPSPKKTKDVQRKLQPRPSA